VRSKTTLPNGATYSDKLSVLDPSLAQIWGSDASARTDVHVHACPPSCQPGPAASHPNRCFFPVYAAALDTRRRRLTGGSGRTGGGRCSDHARSRARRSCCPLCPRRSLGRARMRAREVPSTREVAERAGILGEGCRRRMQWPAAAQDAVAGGGSNEY
jgi:hypothetical protein